MELSFGFILSIIGVMMTASLTIGASVGVFIANKRTQIQKALRDSAEVTQAANQALKELVSLGEEREKECISKLGEARAAINFLTDEIVDLKKQLIERKPSAKSTPKRK